VTWRIALVAGYDATDRARTVDVLVAETGWVAIDSGTHEQLLAGMWGQVEAATPGIIVSGPFASHLRKASWLDGLNYDLGLRGYEATVIYHRAAAEAPPALDPEHYVFDPETSGAERSAQAALVAVELAA
jgi:hypothetical protein